RITTVIMERIVHMTDPHRAAIRYSIIPENYSDEIHIRSILNGNVKNAGVPRYSELNSQHLNPVSSGRFMKNGTYLVSRTNESKITIAVAEKVYIYSGRKQLSPKVKMINTKKNKAIHEFTIYAKRGKRYSIEKIVGIYTSRDKGVKNPRREALTSVRHAPSFKNLYASHTAQWKKLWNKYDIQFSGDRTFQKALRLHIFHLLQSASSNNTTIDASVGARGLHGEAYRGHIFWDELFAMPFYDLHQPEISRSLLLYRYRRLPKARAYAKENGYDGAMFPWQSGSSGVEETQEIHLNPLSGKWAPDLSRAQRHVSFAIAYNVWEYWIRTGDKDFIDKFGAEIILSIAMFCASLVHYDRKSKKYHTKGIMGPDEFHEKLPGKKQGGLEDNAYSNMLISWTLTNAQKAYDILSAAAKKRLLKKLKLEEQTITSWHEIAENLNVIINKYDIISQFKGYFGLKDINWKAYKKRYRDIHRMDRILKAEGKSPDNYKIAKQADVLMAFYLFRIEEVNQILKKLGCKTTHSLLRKNYDYYLQRTSHGSTLSKVVHCYIALLLNRWHEAWRLFVEVMYSDIKDTQGGTTEEGIHVGVMAGSVTLVIRAFAGFQILEDKIIICPHIPEWWKTISFKVLCRGHWITVKSSNKTVQLKIQGPKSKTFPLPIKVNGITKMLTCGTLHTLKRTHPNRNKPRKAPHLGTH
ncbi:glycoside hydrolase family 65 protein, partial [Candidatus Omnitrophota bacterium]